MILVSLSFSAGNVDGGVARGQDDQTTWQIGFFEGGAYPAHNDLRQQVYEQLPVLAPSGVTVVFAPHGFKSAGWIRDTSRQMAAELTADTTIDLVFALGPWTVEDLLEAGFDRPIVAMFRWDPVAEGIADSTGRPVAENLTVRVRPGKIRSDLSLFAQLLDIKKLGVVYFPSNDESEQVIAEVRSVGERLGFEVVSAEGYDRNGTFAVFNAYNELPRSIDALYVPPLWGSGPNKVRQYYRQAFLQRKPTLASEGEFHVSRGAAVAASGESARAAARFHVWKTEHMRAVVCGFLSSSLMSQSARNA
jgi:ABC-type uncharacterized transport system substrate-binding protein